MNDLISKEAVLKIIDNEIQNTSDYLQHNTQINIRFAIDELPTVEPVRGEWEYSKEYNTCSCSVCGEIPNCFEPKFCPNCGADMRGEKDD